jgi:CheY-like chemotaxis protein
VGLALVRRVVELHGGSIQARSGGKGLGSEFIARLPMAIQGLQVVSHTPREAAPRIAVSRVLVVDDNLDAADTMAALLQAMGQHVSTVYDGESALAVAQTFKPHLVLLDIGMPRMSGYEVARGLRAMKWEIPPVLVAITGWGQESDRQRASAAGFDQHFVKPIAEEALSELLRQVAVRGTP